MNAKEYLQSVFFLDNKIASNKERVKKYKDVAGNKTSKLSADKVQTTSSKQKMADAVCNYSDLESIIQEDEKKRQEIIDTISLLKPNESIVLYKKYVEHIMNLYEVAEDISRSYSWVGKKHSDGIRSIQKILDERENYESVKKDER